jgi:flagellar hook protein FlgE
MSLFSAINTAVSGLTAQSTSLGNISEDVSNSQTVGFKRVDTNFVDYLTTSTATNNEPGAVVAHPSYVNNIQGAITQTDNPLGMAIAGQGFFAVSQPIGTTNGITTYNPQQFYTRAGDFTMNAGGYMVNSAGQYLNGWLVNPTTQIADQNALVPIQVNQQTFNPLPTSKVVLAANLPAPTGTAPLAAPLSSQITVYDSLGKSHAVTLNWTQATTAPPASAVIPNQWAVDIQVPDADSAGTNGNPAAVDAGSAMVTFGALSGTQLNAVGAPNALPPEGTIGAVVVNASTLGNQPLTTSSYVQALAGTTPVPQPATVTFTTNFGSGDQAITLNLGDYGSTSGVTQFAGTGYSLLGLTQDGVPPGSFSGVTTQANGNVVVNYNNGQTKTIAQIPIITFNAPDALQSQNGQSFTTTPASGSPLAKAASTNGAGNLVIGSVEGSNVDIATEFTNLIVAQQAYSSNAKVVTTANQMMQATLQMIT